MAVGETARLIASLELQDKFSGPAGNAGRAIDGLERKTSTLGRIGSEAGRGLSNLSQNVVRIGAAAGTVLAGGLVASVNAASDLNEEVDKARVVFGPASKDLEAFARGASSIGLSTAEALGAAGAFGNMFNTIGLAQKESADMSETMVKLAADMASFNNEDPSEMLLKLRSGLAGEAEPLRRFGVLLSEATVKQFAYANGIAETGEALTEQQKVQARYGLILEQTAIQQGNFAATADSLANKQRQLKAALTNTGATIGTALLPKITEVATKLQELLAANQPAIAGFAAKLPAVFDKIVELVGNLPWGAIGTSFQLMGAGSAALLNAFTSMPPWIQTAVITGWGLNKLTGGALGNIVGALGSGLIKGVLGMNAGVVNINAGVVNGGPGGIPGGGRGPGGFVGGLAGGLAVGAGVAAAGVAAVEVVNFQNMRTEAIGGLEGILNEMPRKTGAEIDESIAAIESQIALDRPFLEGILFNTNVKPVLEEELAELQQVKAASERSEAAMRDAIPWAQRNVAEIQAFNQSEGTRFANLGAKQDSVASAVRNQHGVLAQIRDKQSNITVDNHITIPVNVNTSIVQNQVYRLRMNTGSGGFI